MPVTPRLLRERLTRGTLLGPRLPGIVIALGMLGLMAIAAGTAAAQSDPPFEQTTATSSTTLPVSSSYCGDASGEGTLSASDALLILYSSVGIGICDARVCDLNLNGLVTATDALALLRYLVGLVPDLECAGRQATPDVGGGIVVTTSTSSTTIFAIPVCGNGTREPGEQCDDGNLLDGDCCSSTCRRAPTATPCDDGNPCTTGDGCLAGACHGTEVPCDDSNECTLDACNPISGACLNVDFVVCDDDNLCTTESCNETTGDCDFVPADCSDALACTSDDCDPETGDCSHGPLDCGDDDPCTVDSCDEGAGGCVNEQVVCTDGNPCTENSCQSESGTCVSNPIDCADTDPCTDDQCDADEGGCTHTPIVCSDGQACTDDFCDAITGICLTTPVDCVDGDPCTTDSCDPTDGSCSGVPIDCSDGNPCTNDACDPADGSCSSSPVDCSDGQACTEDTCDPANGQCTHRAAQCADSDPCTTDSCDDQSGCTHATIDCSLLNGPCAVGQCDSSTGICVGDPTPGTPCDDGDACTTNDACSAVGTCVGGAAIDCSHLDTTCTTGVCSSTGECVGQPNPGSPCSDGDPCTIGDACDAQGACAPDTALDCSLVDTECATGTCDETGVCVAIPDPAKSCDDRNACTLDTCEENCDCTHQPIDCSDGIICTLDSCDPTSGCDNCPLDERCDDGAFCNGVETCNAETGCVAGVLPNCDDGNPCTIDTCSEAVASCLHDAAAGLGTPCEAVGPCGNAGLCNALGFCEPLTTVHEMDVIDFEGLPAGTVLTTVSGDGGNGPIGVAGINPNFPPASPAAIVYDSTCTGGCTGGDADLGTPNQAFGGPGSGSGGGPVSAFPNTVAQGKIAIVAENVLDANTDGLIDNPDDQADTPVELLFDFSALDTVTIYELTMIDVDVGETPPMVELLGPGGEALGTFNAPSTGDNGVTLLGLGPTAGVATVRVKLSCSGAIDDLVFSVETCDGSEGGVETPRSCGQ